ncbi:unnamed protein product, partial [marine sediment metagenome]
MSKTGIAIFIAAATTAAGFISNYISDISAIKSFGIIAAFGILVSFVLTVTFIPSVLQFIPHRQALANKNNDKILDRILGSLSQSIT